MKAPCAYSPKTIAFLLQIIAQKVLGYFRQFDYAHTYCQISSHLQTMTNKGSNLLISISNDIIRRDTGEKLR